MEILAPSCVQSSAIPPRVQHGEKLRCRLATDADAHLTNQFHEPRGEHRGDLQISSTQADGNFTENPGNLDGKNRGFNDLLEKISLLVS